MKVDSVGPTHIKEQDRSDEVVGAAQSTTVQQLQNQAPVRLELTQDLKKRLGDPAASRVTHKPSAKGVLEIQKANGELAAGRFDRTEFTERLSALAVAEFSPAAQAKFIDYLRSHDVKPEALCWAAAKLRQSLPPGDNRVGQLRDYLNARGIRLFSNDKLPEGHPGYHLDRKAFRAELCAFEAEGGVLDKRATRKLMGHLKNVVDLSDLFYAHWQVKRRILDGEIRFESPEDKARVLAMFNEKLDGRVDRKEISYTIRAMRREGFSDEAVAQVKGLLHGIKDDPESLFFAQQMISRELGEALNGSRKRDAGSIPRLKAAEADFEDFFAPLLAGQFDRRSVRRQAIDLYKSGKISRAECAGLMSGAAMSRTPEEFAYASMTVYAQLRETQTAAMLQEAWSDLLETFRRNMSDDTLDANGNIIETVEERLLRQQLVERRIERLRLSAEKTDELATRAALRGGRTSVKAALSASKTPGERSDLLGDMAAIEDADGDLERPRPPRG